MSRAGLRGAGAERCEAERCEDERDHPGVIRSRGAPAWRCRDTADGSPAAVDGPLTTGRVWQILGVPVLAGLFGAAVALGHARPRLVGAWPCRCSHLSGWATAAFAAVATGSSSTTCRRGQHAGRADARSSV